MQNFANRINDLGLIVVSSGGKVEAVFHQPREIDMNLNTLTTADAAVIRDALAGGDLPDEIATNLTEAARQLETVVGTVRFCLRAAKAADDPALAARMETAWNLLAQVEREIAEARS